jgi:predicted AAA+ superfamily ATPase
MRYLRSSLLSDLNQRMVLLSGPRQCGKTTFSRSLLKHPFTGDYLNWDHTPDRKRILKQEWDEDAELLVLDEVHKKKNWKTFLKGIYDTRPSRLKLLITGSARLEFFMKSGDSLFGRFNSWRLHPFCLAEDPLHLSPWRRFHRQLEKGGFPVPYLSEGEFEAPRWRHQRWLTLLREDCRDLEAIRDLQKLELLAELLKSYAAGILSYANLAEDTEVAPKTAKAWVSVLEKLYLVFTLSPYSGSLKRTLSRSAKVYFLDPGDLLEQSMGVRIENLVAVNLLKRLNFIEDSTGDRVSFHYIRDKEGREVDFVITHNRRPVALIEVKTSDQAISPGLLYFRDRLKVPVAIQLHANPKVRPMKHKGVLLISIPDFFSSPISTRRFWESEKT